MTDYVMLLDACDNVYSWVGENAQKDGIIIITRNISFHRMIVITRNIS